MYGKINAVRQNLTTIAALLDEMILAHDVGRGGAGGYRFTPTDEEAVNLRAMRRQVIQMLPARIADEAQLALTEVKARDFNRDMTDDKFWGRIDAIVERAVVNLTRAPAPSDTAKQPVV